MADNMPNRRNATTIERKVKTVRAGLRHSPARIRGRYFIGDSRSAGRDDLPNPRLCKLGVVTISQPTAPDIAAGVHFTQDRREWRGHGGLRLQKNPTRSSMRIVIAALLSLVFLSSRSLAQI